MTSPFLNRLPSFYLDGFNFVTPNLRSHTSTFLWSASSHCVSMGVIERKGLRFSPRLEQHTPVSALFGIKRWISLPDNARSVLSVSARIYVKMRSDPLYPCEHAYVSYIRLPFCSKLTHDKRLLDLFDQVPLVVESCTPFTWSFLSYMASAC